MKKLKMTFFFMMMFMMLMTVGLWSVAAFAQMPQAAPDQSSDFELNATIMMVDLDQKFMVVAEKNVYLISKTKDGRKVWETLFLSASGQEIPADDFRRKDRVLVQGWQLSSGEIHAKSVTLLETGNDRKMPSSSKNGNSVPKKKLLKAPSPLPIR